MGIAVFHPAPDRSRFELALAISLLLHALLGAALGLEPPARARQAAASASLTVRIDPQSAVILVEPVAPITQSLPGSNPGKPREAPAATGVSRERKEAAILVLPPDPTYYSMRDLDTYPRPAVPLELDRIAANAGASIRLTLLIDEGGGVNEIELVEPASQGPSQEAVRALLAAARFIPGRKDGRAVKSRMLLDVTFRPERREP